MISLLCDVLNVAEHELVLWLQELQVEPSSDGGPWTVNGAKVEMIIEPLVPVTLRVYTLAGLALHERVEVAVVVEEVRLTVDGFNAEQVRPDGVL